MDYNHSQVRYIAGIGGKNLGDFVRRALGRLLSNGVMSNFSVKGKRGKKNLQALRIYSILLSRFLINDHWYDLGRFDLSVLVRALFVIHLMYLLLLLVLLLLLLLSLFLLLLLLLFCFGKTDLSCS